eukprot:scaffold18278_cov100-Isochrysis_galbana.AAC.6
MAYHGSAVVHVSARSRSSPRGAREGDRAWLIRRERCAVATGATGTLAAVRPALAPHTDPKQSACTGTGGLQRMQIGPRGLALCLLNCA